MTKGWFGMRSELMSALEVFGADRDGEGNFMLYGKPVYSGLDKEEIVVPAETEFSVEGQRRNLSHAMSTTSYGLNIAVIA